MKWIKTFETKFTESDKFKQWFKDSKMVNPDGTPKVVYHGTNAEFRRFNTKIMTYGLIWFSSDRSHIEKGESGAVGSSIIKELYVRITNPAGWEQYEKYGESELFQMGYDGVILPDNETRFCGFVFNSNQIRIAK